MDSFRSYATFDRTIPICDLISASLKLNTNDKFDDSKMQFKASMFTDKSANWIFTTMNPVHASALRTFIKSENQRLLPALFSILDQVAEINSSDQHIRFKTSDFTKRNILVTPLLMLAHAPKLQNFISNLQMQLFLQPHDYENFIDSTETIIPEQYLVHDGNCTLYNIPSFPVIISSGKESNTNLFNLAKNKNLIGLQKVVSKGIRFVRQTYSAELVGPKSMRLNPIIQELLYSFYSIARMNSLKQSITVPTNNMLHLTKGSDIIKLARDPFNAFIIKFIPNGNVKTFRDTELATLDASSMPNFMNDIIESFLLHFPNFPDSTSGHELSNEKGKNLIKQENYTQHNNKNRDSNHNRIHCDNSDDDNHDKDDGKNSNNNNNKNKDKNRNKNNNRNNNEYKSENNDNGKHTYQENNQESQNWDAVNNNSEHLNTTTKKTFDVISHTSRLSKASQISQRNDTATSMLNRLRMLDTGNTLDDSISGHDKHSNSKNTLYTKPKKSFNGDNNSSNNNNNNTISNSNSSRKK